MATTNTNVSTAKRLEDYGLKPTTAEELQAKFDAVTRAEYDRQRTDLKTATNQYYNQLYNTQNTAMDTIRQANAQAVASGASKGVQAANELSAILGLQSEAATGAADIANQATTLAQDETTAMLENMLNAETQAAEYNQALAQLGIQQDSVDVERENAESAKNQTIANMYTTIETIRQTNPTLANTLQDWLNKNYINQNTTGATGTTENTATITPENLNQVYTNYAPTFDSFTKDTIVKGYGLPADAVTVEETSAGANGARFKTVRVAADKLSDDEKAAFDKAMTTGISQDNGGGGRWTAVKNNEGKIEYYLYLVAENTYNQRG